MNRFGRKWYWFSLIGVGLLCVLYVKQRNVEERIKSYRESEATVEELQAQVDALRLQVEEGRKRVEDLKKDPVEQEAAIRRWSRKLREGESYHHVQLKPEGASAPAAPAASENGIPDPN